MIKHPSEKKESNKLSVGKYFFSLYTRKLTRQNLTFSKNNENNSKIIREILTYRNKSDNSFRPPSVFELNHLAKSSSGSNLPWPLNQQYSTPISTIIYNIFVNFSTHRQPTYQILAIIIFFESILVTKIYNFSIDRKEACSKGDE